MRHARSVWYVDDLDARWSGLDGGDQSYVRRATRRGRRVEPGLADVAVLYARRRLERWWLDVLEIAPAIALLLVLPAIADRRDTLLTSGHPVVRTALVLAFGAGFVLVRRLRYAKAARLNAAPAEPAGSR